MFADKVSDYFEGAAAKYLSAVDADPESSNQHEIGGLPSVGFKQWLGTPAKGEKLYYPSRQVYITDDLDEPVISEGQVSWYDARHNNPDRSPEYRLYYTTTPVMRLIRRGDFFLVAKNRNGALLMAFAPAGSSAEQQLRSVFGIDQVGDAFNPGKLDVAQLLLPLRLMLESLGIELSRPGADDGMWLDRLIQQFGGDKFPVTSAFSTFARESLDKELEPVSRPDQALMGWMDHEERLFRIYERHVVRDRLLRGFGENGDDVDAFVDFSLSVQNRRKSRAGHAFEGHLAQLFRCHGLRFERGVGDRFTENKSRPDFLFPAFREYHDPDFPDARLLMLGAKTSCKDRWRQVLSEANRIPRKHLVTLEAAISEHQTNEMRAHNLNLVVPAAIQTTYTEGQRAELIDLQGFIALVKVAQKS